MHKCKKVILGIDLIGRYFQKPSYPVIFLEKETKRPNTV